MTPEEEDDIARRLVTLDWWEWRPGMRDGCTYSRYPSDQMGGYGGGWPDLRDDATAGCLLAMLRERWEATEAKYTGKCWLIWLHDGSGWFDGGRSTYLGVAAARALLAVHDG